MWIGLWALAAITAGCAFAFLRRAVRSAAAWVWRSRMWLERFAFIGLFSVSLLFGGGKTNSPPLLMMPFPPSLQQTAVPSVTQEEIAQGWRFVGETNCAAEVYTMPDGFSPTFTWHRRGTFGEWARFGEDLQQVFRIDQHGRVGVFKLDNWVIRTTNDVVTLRGPITAELP